MKIYIVIPVHNRKALTKDCLQSLQQQSDENFEIVVIDDGSTDGTGEMIRQQFPDVVLLQGDGNLWWVGAVNEGIRHVLDICNPDDYILLLNDDLIVPQNCISQFRKLASTFPNTLIGSVVVDINDRDIVAKGGVRINWITAKHHKLNQGKVLSSFPEGFYVEVSFLTGRGVLIPSKVFRDVGLYKAHYVQCGDPELTVRAAKAGYRLIVSYDAVVFSYPADKDHINSKTEYRLSDLATYFGDIRSHFHLRTKFWFAYDTASSLPQGMVYYVCDVARIVHHFMRRLRL